MKKWMVVLALLLSLAAGANAQEMQMRLFVSKEALQEQTAKQLIRLLEQEYPQTQWMLEMEGEESLREQVLLNCAPQLAICTPGEMRPWAKEGLLLPLTLAVQGQSRIQEEVLACCECDEQLFMLPLLTRQRKIAVNRDWFEAKRMEYLLSEIDHPVWYLSQFQQIIEEFALHNVQAFEIWPPQEYSSAGLEAFVQALFGGRLMEENGANAVSAEIRAGVKWLCGMVHSGMIGYVSNREEALERFINGKTPVFIDWTEETTRRFEARDEKQTMEILLLPYPSSSGEMNRMFELAGVSAFAGEDERMNELCMKAVAFLHEDQGVQTILGRRRIARDDAVWIADVLSYEGGATLRALFAQALQDMIENKTDADASLKVLQAALDAAQ